MTMNGTDGNTLEEFRTSLKAEKFYPNGINTHYKTLLQELNPKEQATTLSLNNTIFFDDQWVDLDDQFINVMEDVYSASVSSQDFGDSGTVDVINNWAEDKTEGKIKEVLKEIKEDEVLFLINALYMLADWELGFEPNYTSPQDFQTMDGNQIEIDFMNSDDIRRYVIEEEYSAVDLPFKGGDYSMTFVLPKTNVRNYLSEFETATMRTWMDNMYASLREERVLLEIPKFEMSNKILLNDMLIDSGMETAFEAANLDRMGQFYGGQTYLSRVIHDAFIKVDEKGIEGAAVTTVGVGVESLPPQIVFNRPFFFIVRHVETNTAIFIGRFGDPS